MMRFNREFRTTTMIKRSHIIWAIFYISCCLLIAVFVRRILTEHDNESILHSQGVITLRASKQTYNLGETVHFTIKNTSDKLVYAQNRCPSEPMDVYIWTNQRWLQLHDNAVAKDSSCFKQPRKIAIGAGQSIDYSFKDWPHLFTKAGQYRIVLPVDHYDDSPYQDFKVLDPTGK